jgi:O-antigen ligase
MIDRVEFPGTPDNPEVKVAYGIAFHSVYFEVLGEQGWVGLGLFLSLMGSSLLTLQSVLRRTRRVPHLLWCHDLAAALQNALLILMVCGNFIGIAFQPMLYYLFALSACLRQHVIRIEAFQKPAQRLSPLYLREREPDPTPT